MTCGADTTGTALRGSLIEDVPYVIPNVSLTGTPYSVPADSALTATISKLTNSDLTTDVGGTGTFDALMTGLSAHLRVEYEKNRITGAEYTKAFVALTEAAMAQGISYLVQREGQYWSNLLTQQQAELAEVQVATSRIKLETAKVEHVATQMQAVNLEADYGIKKLQMSKLSSEFCLSEYELNNMMPRKLAMLNSQITGQLINNDTATWNLSTMLPSQHTMILRQIDGQVISNDTATWNLGTMLPSQHTMVLRQITGQEINNNTATWNLSTMLPSQHAMLLAQITGQNTNNDGSRYNVDYTLPAQLNILLEQYEATRAQTLDTRSNGTTVAGTLGAQRRLHNQQVQSYIQDTRIKVSKMYNDLWITMVTINDELIATAPPELRGLNVAAVMADLRVGVELDGNLTVTP